MTDHIEVRNLLITGRNRGYVSYEEVLSSLPPGEVGPSVRDVLSALKGIGVAVLGTPDAEQKPAEASDEHLDTVAPRAQSEEELAHALWTVVVSCPAALRRLTALGGRWRGGVLLTTHADLSRQSASMGSAAGLAAQADGDKEGGAAVLDLAAGLVRLRRIEKVAVRLQEQLDSSKKISQARRRLLVRELSALRSEMAQMLSVLPLPAEVVDDVVEQIRPLALRARAARDSLGTIEARIGMSHGKAFALIREARDGRRRVPAELMRITSDIDGLEKEIRTARRRIRIVEDESGVPVDVLSRQWAMIQAVLDQREELRFRKKISATLNGARPPVEAPARRHNGRVSHSFVAGRHSEITVDLLLRTLDAPPLKVRSFSPSAESRAGARRSRRLPARPRLSLERYVAPRPDIDPAREQIGLVGEALVFKMYRDRWRGLVGKAPLKAQELLRIILTEYWAPAADPDLVDEIEKALEHPERLFGSSLFEVITWPARSIEGPRMGFDVFGLDESLEDICCVEVKSTAGDGSKPFELTAHEYLTAKRLGSRYVIARVSGLSIGRPTLEVWRDPIRLEEEGRLLTSPTGYMVTPLRVS